MEQEIIEDFNASILDKAFPCVAAKDALQKDNIKIFTATHMACPHDDKAILNFIYAFTEQFRKSESGFHSAVILFPQTNLLDEASFERFLFQRLAALRVLDEEKYKYDPRVSEDPASDNFSFSLMEEAFFIIGLHPGSSRPARQFKHAAIIFNPHVQFDNLRAANRYDKLKAIVRKRDTAYSGSVNPMLSDFGSRSEVFQYSGKFYGATDRCPFIIDQQIKNV